MPIIQMLPGKTLEKVVISTRIEVLYQSRILSDGRVEYFAAQVAESIVSASGAVDSGWIPSRVANL